MKIKVCGMRLAPQIEALDTMGVDFIGLIFHPGSPRYASEPVLDTKIPKAMLTGVFVESSLEEILKTALKYGLTAIQLHGGQDQETCLNLKEKGFTVIKVFHPAQEDFSQTKAFDHCADYFLFDSAMRKSGGSGKKFDWNALSEYQGKTPFLLSGGIGFDDLDAIRQINHPAFAGIDLNSRFELAPGIKNLELLTSFIHQLKS